MESIRSLETVFIVGVQRTRLARRLVRPAEALSLFGEKAVGWILLGLLGAVIDESRAGAWLLGALSVAVAQLVSVAVKRVAGRERPGAVAAADGGSDPSRRGSSVPGDPGPVIVYGKAPSRLSFPSSHASSTMAAAVVYTALLPALWPVGVCLPLAMGGARILLGMHFPTDVLAGYVVGLAVGLTLVLLLR